MNALQIPRDHVDLLASVPASYRTEARRFLEYCDDNGFSLESYQGFIGSLDGSYTVATTNKYIAASRRIIRAMFESPHITDLQKWTMKRALDSVPYRKIARGERAVGGDKVLSSEELSTLIERSPRRTALMIRFLYETGCRVSEACAATVDRCKVNGTVQIRIFGKGNKERTVRCSRSLFDEIRTVFNGHYLFESASGRPLHDRNVAKEISRLSMKHLGRHVTPHMLRHSRATDLIKATGNVKGVADYLGHATAQTTLDMYDHNQLSEDDLQIT